MSTHGDYTWVAPSLVIDDAFAARVFRQLLKDSGVTVALDSQTKTLWAHDARSGMWHCAPEFFETLAIALGPRLNFAQRVDRTGHNMVRYTSRRKVHHMLKELRAMLMCLPPSEAPARDADVKIV